MTADALRTMVPLLVVLHPLSRDRETMGDLAVSRRVAAAQGVVVLLVCGCVVLILVQVA